MKTTCKVDLKTKQGTSFAAGTSFDVRMIPGSDTLALAAPVGVDGKPIRVWAKALYKYFHGFIKINVTKVMSEEYYERGSVKSLTGADVEPDGYDSYGFPSILVAAGYI